MSQIVIIALVISTALLAGNLAIAESYTNHIYVDEALGEDSSQCLESNNDSQPCRSLEWVLNQPQGRRNSTRLLLSGGVHTLTKPLPPIQDIHSLAIYGSRSVICCNQSLSGLMFLNVRNILLYNISIFDCGMVINTTSLVPSVSLGNRSEFYKTYASLYFYQSVNITIDAVVLNGHFGAAGLVFLNTIGHNIVKNSTFSGSDQANASSQHLGLGGVYIEYAYCIPGDISCNNTKMDASISKFNFGSHFIFKEVQFCNNTARDDSTIDKNAFVVPHKTIHSPFGKGGGLALVFKGNASRNRIELENCSFVRNRARCGSGLFVEFQDISSSNVLKVTNTVFSNNGFSDTTDFDTIGGGVRVSQYVFTSPDPVQGQFRNSFTLESCNITENEATIGGGVSIAQARGITEHHDSSIGFSILNSSLASNVAQLGAALEANIYSSAMGHLLPILIQDSNFENNVVNDVRNKEVVLEGVACIYTNSIPLFFQGNNQFKNNTGSALMMSGTAVHFTNSCSYFIGNVGKYGGAIQIRNSAYIVVDDETSLSFVNNHARMHGGAIANMNAEKERFEIYSSCFFRHSCPFMTPNDWSATITFESNTAIHLGPSIFTSSLSPCSWTGMYNKDEIFCWNGWTYYRANHHSGCVQEISTAAANISLGGNPLTITAFPGKENILSMTVLDELQNNVSSDVVLKAEYEEGEISDVVGYYNKGYLMVKINRMENDIVKVVLRSAQEPFWHVELDFHSEPCPPGFELHSGGPSNASAVCMCSDLTGLLCSNFQASLRNGYWLGRLNDGTKVWRTSLCSTYFCHWNKSGLSVNLPLDQEKLNDRICHHNRTGVLCSLCIKGFGVSVGSNDFSCVPCREHDTIYNVMKYVASVCIPLLLLFLILMIFGIRLTSGPANAFIFYAQTISSTLDLTADRHVPVDKYSKHGIGFIQFYHLIYGVFNLEFIESILHPFCISTKLNTLDVLQLGYVIAAFPLLIILIVVGMMKIKHIRNCCRLFKFNALRKNASQSLLHVFSAYLLLSYTKFTLISLSMIKQAHLHVEKRAYFAGQYKVTDSEYIWRYWAPAWIILTVTNILPIILLRYPVLLLEKIIRKITCISEKYPSDKVHIFLDTFQGCYRDNRRYFAGMYFLFRLSMGMLYATSRDWFHQYMLQLFLCIAFIFLVGLLRPYRKEYSYLNFVDISMFTNLALVNLMSLYMLSFGEFEFKQFHSFTFVFELQLLLVFLPLVYITAYAFWHLLLKNYQKMIKKVIFNWNMKAKAIACRLFGKVNYKDMKNDTHVENSLGAILDDAEKRTIYNRVPKQCPSTECLDDKEDSDLKQRGKLAVSGATHQRNREEVLIKDRYRQSTGLGSFVASEGQDYGSI